MIKKIKDTISLLTPAIVGVASIWGLDIAAIAASTETFVLAVLTYAEFWISYKKSK